MSEKAKQEHSCLDAPARKLLEGPCRELVDNRCGAARADVFLFEEDASTEVSPRTRLVPVADYPLVSAEGFQKMICDQFDVLYKEGAKSGRVMAIALHPYLIGVPHRIGGLDAALAYIRSHDRVWFATGEEIVRHWLQSGATF